MSSIGVYLDTNFFISLIEVREEGLKEFLERASDRTIELYTSELTLSEALVKPIQLDLPEVVDMYENAIRSGPFMTVLPVDRDVLRRSAQLRAELNNKLPDSIHLATADIARCRFIATSDKRLRLPDGVLRIDATQFEGLDTL